MKYNKSSKFFYKHGAENYDIELRKRKNGYSSYLTGLNVKIFQKGSSAGEDYELFYVDTHIDKIEPFRDL